MGEPYDKALEAIRQLREMGATRVKVGEIEAEFASAAATSPAPQAVDVFADLEPTEEEIAALEREAKAAFEREQYWSVG